MIESTRTATITTTAIKSECGLYRYVLKRMWDEQLEIGAFLCANPSKADHLLSDDTVCRCGNLAVHWNWGGFYILNLYPKYSTDPRNVTRSKVTDDQNEQHVSRVISEVRTLVLACGNGHKNRFNELIKDVPVEKLFCLRKNSGDGFLHPSRIKPEDFPSPIAAFR